MSIKDWLIRKFLVLGNFVINYILIMVIVRLTYVIFPFGYSQSFIGIGLTILLGFYFAYAIRRD
jgi:hypothetical protein